MTTILEPTTTHVQIGDYSDREIIAIMHDLSVKAGSGGVVTARDLALRLFGVKDLEENADEIRHVTRCVTARMSWMRRYGLVEKGEFIGEWYLSETGRAFRAAKLGALANSIDGADDTKALALANTVGEKMVKSSPVAARAMRRELQFQIGRRTWV